MNEIQTPMRSVHRYSPEEDIKIVEAVQTAKIQDLELSTVFECLADELGVITGNAVRQRYYTISKGTTEVVAKEPMRILKTKELNVIEQVQKVVDERDMYKRMHEQAKAELDAIRKLVEG